MSDSVDNLSVKELKEILQKRGVNYADCFEKTDLIRRVKETASRDVPKKSNGKMEKKIGNLQCNVVENCGSNTPDLVIIMSHGYGANNEDLVPIGTSLLQKFQNICFIFPNAPGQIDPNDSSHRCWWPLNMQELMMKMMMGDYKSLFHDTPVGLKEARESLEQVIEEVKNTYKIPTSKIVLAGFSQGSMLSVDVALHLNEQVAAVAVFSGVGISQETWKLAGPNRKGLKVFQSHGTQDPLLPYQLGLMLKNFFETHEMELTFMSFNDGHTIPASALTKFAEFLSNLLKSGASL